MTSAGMVRALRRFKARLMKKRVAQHHPELKTDPKHVGRLAGAPQRCTCPQCTRDRKYAGRPISELRHMRDPEPEELEAG